MILAMFVLSEADNGDDNGGNNLDETTLLTTTAIAAASNSASTVYSTTARTSLAFRVIGYIESTQATAGTWATAPSTIQGYGGQALSAMSSIGYGQTVQTVTRTSGTTYYNTTGKPIFLSCYITSTASASTTTLSINSGTAFYLVYAVGNHASTGSFIIPINASYVLTNDANVLTRTNTELR